MGKCISVKKVDLPRNHSIAEYTFSINIKTIYSIEEFCGSGHYGTVNKAVSLADPSQIFAIKRISKDFIRNTDHLRREVDILCTLHHPNIIKIYETYQDMHFFYIVMQYCSGGTLYSRVSGLKLTEEKAANLIKQIIEAVIYLQSKGICHRDIKPENFLFSSNKKSSKLILIDFGLSHKLGKWFKGMNDLVGTVYYIAPEVITGKYNEKCDNWSVGVIMYLLLSGSLPFQGNSEAQIIHKILHCEVPYDPEIWRSVSPQGRDLVHKLLCKNPSERIDMNEAYLHPWFSVQVDDDTSHAHIHTFQVYTLKEELVMNLTNHVINTMNYKDIEKLIEVTQDLTDDSVSLNEFEKLTRVKYQGHEQNVIFSARKVLKGALWAKLHLNEEKLWKAFGSYDFEKTGKVPLKGLIEISEVLEGKNSRSFDGIDKKLIYTFEDIMKIYDNGKLLTLKSNYSS